MNFENWQELWMKQPSPATEGDAIDETIVRVRAGAKSFDRTILWRDFREVAAPLPWLRFVIFVLGLGIIAAVGVPVYRLNQRVARKELLPRIEELERLRRAFLEEGEGGVPGHAPYS